MRKLALALALLPVSALAADTPAAPALDRAAAEAASSARQAAAAQKALPKRPVATADEKAPASRPALASAAARRPRVTCRFKTIERNDCVYRCSDGSELRRPVNEPPPWDPQRPTVLCPQVVIPF